MKIQSFHPDFQLPTRGSEHAAGYDIYMPTDGEVSGTETVTVLLGFASEIPEGYVALLLPRSSAAKTGLELANTCGVIDADYRGEWMAKIRVKNGGKIQWFAGDRLLQFVLVPCFTPVLEVVESVTATDRGAGGFGSTGN